ncbi:MAG: DoxX family protein [Ginsengibacter sp.]
MKRIFSTKYNHNALNFGLLLLRVMLGILLMKHGYDKLSNFDVLKHSFGSFMGMSSMLSLSLIIFAEFFCSLFLVLGLFTRFACIPIIVGMAVVVFVANGGHIFGKGETPVMYLAAAITILFTGPGKFSLDGGIWK